MDSARMINLSELCTEIDDTLIRNDLTVGEMVQVLSVVLLDKIILATFDTEEAEELIDDVFWRLRNNLGFTRELIEKGPDFGERVGE